MKEASCVYGYDASGFKAAVLSLSLLTIMSGAGVAPGIGRIAEAFPDVSETVVKLVVSLPPLFMIVSALLTGFLSHYVRHKTLIITGLLLFLVGGVGAGFSDGMGQLLLFRATIGLGTGIILPFSTSLVAACYEGAERSRMMGFSFAANCLGAVIGNVLAGFLTAAGWRYMFNIYWIGLVPLALVLLFVKELPASAKPADGGRLPSEVFPLSAFTLLTMIVFFLIVTNLSLIVSERGLGTSRLTGYLFAVNSIAMLGAGILLTVSMRLKRYFLPAAFLLISAGLFGIAAAQSAAVLFVSIVLAGLGIGSLFPYLLNLVSERIPKEQSVKAMSILMVSAWFGQFLSPLIFGLASSLTGLDTSVMFLSVAGMFAVVAAGRLLSPAARAA